MAKSKLKDLLKAPVELADQLRARAVLVAQIRVALQQYTSIRQNMLSELEMSEPFVINDAARLDAKEQLDEAEQALRDLAVEGFEETAQKKVIDGVSIRVSAGIDYDEDLALEWCETHLPAAIKRSVDRPTFEATVKNLPADKRPEFVEFNDYPKAVIATRLLEHLPMDEVIIGLPQPEEFQRKRRPNNWKEIRELALTRDEYRCRRCRRTAEADGVQLEVDHIHPVSMGGSHALSNLRTLCSECHNLLQVVIDPKERPDGKAP